MASRQISVTLGRDGSKARSSAEERAFRILSDRILMFWLSGKGVLVGESLSDSLSTVRMGRLRPEECLSCEADQHGDQNN
jgi:hypothetical protein